MDTSLISAVNTLGRFCGPRDIPALSRERLEERYGFASADLMVLFGGSILAGGELLAEGIKQKIAGRYAIVGGAGHTTPALREKMRSAFPDWDTANLPEALLFDGYLKRRHGLSADLLECRSTNCGNNITFLLDMLEEARVPIKNCILVQDATMQRRMAAVLRKYRPDLTVINYAAYQVRLTERAGKPAYEETPYGMWEPERYAALLAGEIPRLRDDAEGYGPKGKNYLAHEEIPQEVLRAYERISRYNPALARSADPAFARPER